MSTSVETPRSSSALDAVLWVLVAVLVAAAVVGNAYFASGQYEQPLLYRVIGVVVAGVLAALIASYTNKGRTFVNLLKEARAEVRRVVWPTKQETIQTTGIVVLVVAIMALLLWLLDWVLGKSISALIG